MHNNLLITALLCLFSSILGWSQTAVDGLTEDSLQRLRMQPDFVKASICIASRGEVLYSNVGHTFFRMQCPTFGIDNCFSYESENVPDNILRFFAGKLNMGMVRIQSAPYIDEYRKDGRGLLEYQLNLSPEAKLNLWRILDNRANQGIYLPYDAVQRGCTRTALEILIEAVGTTEFHVDAWPERYQLTLREKVITAMTNDWGKFFVHLLSSIYVDRDLSNVDKTAVPTDLVDVLKRATVNGQHVITSEPTVLLQDKKKPTEYWFTPIVMSIILLLLSLTGMRWFTKPIALTMVTMQSLLGVFLTHMTLSGLLLGGEWSILLIPFNPLPILLWRWRKWWAGIYTLVLIGWILIVALYPHQFTDPAFVIAAISLVIIYSKHINLKPLKL